VIRWIDMVDPVYTLCQLVGVDPDENDIRSINIANDRLTIWYNDADGIRRSKYENYNLE
jgi:uncharacterized protein YccT (UPF0319 family)